MTVEISPCCRCFLWGLGYTVLHATTTLQVESFFKSFYAKSFIWSSTSMCKVQNHEFSRCSTENGEIPAACTHKLLVSPQAFLTAGDKMLPTFPLGWDQGMVIKARVSQGSSGLCRSSQAPKGHQPWQLRSRQLHSWFQNATAKDLRTHNDLIARSMA